MPTLERIWIKPGRGDLMEEVFQASLIAQVGLEGCVNQGGSRQVTLIDLKRWQEICRGLGADIDPSRRRANLLLDGIDLTESEGMVLVIGTARVRILGETVPCAQMDDAHPGLQRAMEGNWNGGAYAEVLASGNIQAGNTVRVQAADEEIPDQP